MHKSLSTASLYIRNNNIERNARKFENYINSVDFEKILRKDISASKLSIK